MKFLKLCLLTGFVGFLTVANGAQLKIQVKPYKQIKGGEFTVCLDKAKESTGFYEAFDTMVISKVGEFEINNLKKGRYVVALLHPSSEILLYNIYIADQKSVVEMDVELDRITIPEKIDSIRIVGDGNKWNHWGGGMKMKFNQKKKYWYLPKAEVAENLTVYYFVINQNEKKHSFDLPIGKKGASWADMHNTYKPEDGDIIFKQDNFQRGKSHPKITIKGNEADYSMVYDTLKNLGSRLMTSYSEAYQAKVIIDYRASYSTVEQKLKKLKDQYGSRFPWLFPDVEMALCDFNPIMLEYILTYETPQGEAVRFSEDYLNNYRNKALVLKGLEKSELMLTPRLIQELQSFPKYYMADYGLFEELNIPYGYFEQFLDDVCKEFDDAEISGGILFAKADRMVYARPDKAKSMLLAIMEKYPNFSGVKNGTIEKVLKTFSIVVGKPAPDFSVLTLDGKEISLASLKGKYVFLDFWGTWCGPCVGEIPNVKKLHESIPAEELVVLGICRDNEKAVKDFVAENGITYGNAIASAKVLSDYGVRSFPTTYLIGKNGEIVGKNLRGSNLVEMVKSAMESMK
jgi:peroxiredoxin